MRVNLTLLHSDLKPDETMYIEVREELRCLELTLTKTVPPATAKISHCIELEELSKGHCNIMERVFVDSLLKLRRGVNNE